jgi:hypothetical protein
LWHSDECQLPNQNHRNMTLFKRFLFFSFECLEINW